MANASVGSAAAAARPLNLAHWTPMRASGLSFCIPLWISVQQGRFVGTAILSS